MGQGHLLGNRYRLETAVGRGGMGTVWRAYDEVLDRDVAIKEVLLPPGLSPTERDVLYERTFREARASARLNHPGVVTVHDVVEEAGRPWIVMELVLARSLQDMIEQDGVLPPWKAAEIGRQTLSALKHAHEKGILHRDVKPSNVLITAAPAGSMRGPAAAAGAVRQTAFRAVLTDFGIAQVEGDATLTQTGLVMGSPAYIPPERAQGERAVPASDLWALGATLYAAVEGHSPYERFDAMASLAAALSEPVPPPRNAGPLRGVLEGLLAREPYQRMNIDRALELLAEVADEPPPPPGPEMTEIDRTQLDQPPPFPPQRQEWSSGAAETLLDSDEVEAATKADAPPGWRPPVPSTPPPGPTAPRRPTVPPTPSSPGSSTSSPASSGAARRADQDEAERARASRAAARGTEQRTLLETDWSPPPPTSQSYYGWQQQHAQPSSLDRQRRERTKTAVIVTVSVILIVAAVVIGAYIVRQKLNADAAGAVPRGTAADGSRGPRAGLEVLARDGDFEQALARRSFSRASRV